MTPSTLTITLRPPLAEDGASVFQLISQCPPLDTNSMYCNLLQCSHFSTTSVIAIYQKKPVGFISSYVIPERPHTLFIWQVAVSEEARKQGLGMRMLENILDRPVCSQINYLETTITESNRASWALFKKLADTLNTTINTKVLFDKDTHFNNQHDSETLVRIGPFNKKLSNKKENES